MKKFLSIFVVLGLVLSLFSVGFTSRLSAKAITEGNFNYALDPVVAIATTFTALPSYTLTPSAGNGGTISPNTGQTVPQGESSTFAVLPKEGYRITGVTVDGTSQGIVSSYTFNRVVANHTINASFEKEKQQQQTIMVLQIGDSRFTINGILKTLDSPPIIKNGRTLVPIRAIIEELGGSVGWEEVERKAAVTLEKTSLELWIGKSTALVNGINTPIEVTNAKVVPEIIKGRTMLPLRFVTENLGAKVEWKASSQTITLIYTTSSSPIILETVDSSAVTHMAKSSSYGGKNYYFEIIRIDLKGKGIRVVPVAAPGGMNSGAPYTTFANTKPLAMINALPFDTTTHVMTGSLGGGGSYPQVKVGYSETIGIDEQGIPFYAEGRLETRVDVTVGGKLTSITTYSINSTSWGGFTVYTSWYPKAIEVGSKELLIVVDQGRIVQRIHGETFQPSRMKAGQYALYGYQVAVDHWTTDIVALLRGADTAELHVFLGGRDLTKSFFIQCAPVVLKAGQPIMGAESYSDSIRMTKAGIRSFLGIGGGRYLYFISSSTLMSLRTDNVGGALAQLKLFSDVISLDGGASTTLYYKGKYIYTPGRQLVTCLIVPRQ